MPPISATSVSFLFSTQTVYLWGTNSATNEAIPKFKCEQEYLKRKAYGKEEEWRTLGFHMSWNRWRLCFTQKQALLRMNPLVAHTTFPVQRYLLTARCMWVWIPLLSYHFHFWSIFLWKRKTRIPPEYTGSLCPGGGWARPQEASGPGQGSGALNSPVFVWLVNHYSFLSVPWNDKGW